MTTHYSDNNAEVTHGTYTVDGEDVQYYGPELPHTHYNTDKLDAMIAKLESGEELPAVLVLTNNQAISGTHRLLAWQYVEQAPDCVVVPDELWAAVDEALYGNTDDYNDVYAKLAELADKDEHWEIIEALRNA